MKRTITVALMALIISLCLYILSGCSPKLPSATQNEGSSASATTSDIHTENQEPEDILYGFSRFLDMQGFDFDVSEGDFLDAVEAYTREDVMVIPSCGIYEQGISGGNDSVMMNYSHSTYFERISTKFSFKAEATVKGMSLPFGISPDDTLKSTLQKLGLDLDPVLDFVDDDGVKDGAGGEEMTLDFDFPGIFYSLTLQRTPLDSSSSPDAYTYSLTYQETQTTSLNDGRLTKKRSMTSSYSDVDLSFKRLEISGGTTRTKDITFSHVSPSGTSTQLDLAEDERSYMLSVLSDMISDALLGALPSCGHDYEISTAIGSVKYHSKCGYLFAPLSVIQLSGEAKERFDSILGVKERSGDADGITEHPEYKTPVTLLLHNWDGYGVSYKTISECSLSCSIIDLLNGMTETGETVDMISDETVNQGSTLLPVDGGTKWLEVGSKIYRISPDFSKIYLVDSHLGGGSAMSMDEELRDMLVSAWYYHPYDYYIGAYDNNTREINLDHVYDADTTVHVHISSINVKNEHDPSNKINIELLSTVDQTVTVSLDCQQSADNLAQGASQSVTLTAGKSKSVNLDFGGWKYHSYDIRISVDNTVVSLTIIP